MTFHAQAATSLIDDSSIAGKLMKKALIALQSALAPKSGANPIIKPRLKKLRAEEARISVAQKQAWWVIPGSLDDITPHD